MSLEDAKWNVRQRNTNTINIWSYLYVESKKRQNSKTKALAAQSLWPRGL